MFTERSTHLMQRLGVSMPLLLAPMAGVADAGLAIAVARAGGLGAIPAALLSPQQLRAEVARFRAAVNAPLNLNFFAHQTREPTPNEIEQWRAALAPLHAELGLQVPKQAVAGRRPFDEDSAALVESLRPEVVSFHFGLPPQVLLERVKASGALVLSSATTVREARLLAERGVDAVIAQGWEAGGHRGMFLDDDIDGQVGTLSLVPQVVDAVNVPVIAAGGIADGRGLTAALVLGASAVQIGTAFLRCPEALTSPAHRAVLATANDEGTRLSNIFTGRPARGLRNRLMLELGPMSALAPTFPYAGSLLTALRDSSVKAENGDFVAMWAGQSAALAREESATDIAARIAYEAKVLLDRK